MYQAIDFELKPAGAGVNSARLSLHMSHYAIDGRAVLEMIISDRRSRTSEFYEFCVRVPSQFLRNRLLRDFFSLRDRANQFFDIRDYTLGETQETLLDLLRDLQNQSYVKVFPRMFHPRFYRDQYQIAAEQDLKNVFEANPVHGYRFSGLIDRYFHLSTLLIEKMHQEKLGTKFLVIATMMSLHRDSGFLARANSEDIIFRYLPQQMIELYEQVSPSYDQALEVLRTLE